MDHHRSGIDIAHLAGREIVNWKRRSKHYELWTRCENVDSCRKWSLRHNLPCRCNTGFRS